MGVLGTVAGQAWEAAATLRGGRVGRRRQDTCLLPTAWKPHGRPWDTRTLAGSKVCRKPGWEGTQVSGAEKEASSAGGVCGVELWDGAVCGVVLLGMLLTGRIH